MACFLKHIKMEAFKTARAMPQQIDTILPENGKTDAGAFGLFSFWFGRYQRKPIIVDRFDYNYLIM